MAATALIKFVQGSNIGIAGQALVGVGGVAVAVSNGNNADIGSWEIDLVYRPPGSSVAVAIHLASNNSNATPTATFTPDVRGCYRIVLRVWALPNKVGTPDIDIRNFIIKGRRGTILPPYQKDPDPLPTLASALPGNKPNETNVNGNEFGWLGITGDALLADILDSIDSGMIQPAFPPVEITFGFTNGSIADGATLPVPATPTGPNRFRGTFFLVRQSQAIVGGGTVALTVATTLGGNDIITAQTVSSATALGDIVAGAGPATLGSGLPATSFYSIGIAAGASFHFRGVTTGSISAGKATLYAYGVALP